MLFFVLILGMSLGFALAYYWFKRESKSLHQQIQGILQEPYSIRRLTLDHGNLTWANLVIDLNRLLDLYQEELSKDQQQAHELRSQLASLSHDLRTPLTAISGYLELLDQPGLSQVDQHRYLATIQERTRFLNQLIQSLFFLSKLETGGVTYHLEAVHLNLRLEEALAASYKQIINHGMDLQVSIEETQAVVTELAGVDRIYANLIANFIQHGQGRTEISHKQQAGAIITRIQNQVKDIETLEVERIFEKHYTGSGKRNYKNSGLGLSIVKDLCQQLGHQVEAHMEADCFIVEIIW
ncbi:sensor histidine kinase [Hutsoniella sourekii]|uniref:sensor histidine kinase n=1 Tax=Hutsoniella sourekii TaxID=87650 RepID=UPI0004AE34D6|nr:HAMP domain-containing sensor histidine kinase [Hutsoniella sourekii]